LPLITINGKSSSIMKNITLILIGVFIIMHSPIISSTENILDINTNSYQNLECLAFFVPEKGYAELTKKVDGGYIQIYNGQELKIHFIQEYKFDIEDFYNNLIYRIYDNSMDIVSGYDVENGIMISGTSVHPLDYGSNYISIDCGSIGYGRFLLEVDTPNGDKLYLRFKRTYGNPG
jgi:hypothetical protein